MLDVSATIEERMAALDVVANLRAHLNIPLTVGGGFVPQKMPDDCSKPAPTKWPSTPLPWPDPHSYKRPSSAFGRQCTVIAIDARSGPIDEWSVMVRGGREKPHGLCHPMADQAQMLGAGEALLTSWDQDGTRNGYDLASISSINAVRIPIIASGGANTANTWPTRYRVGASAVLAASIFHDNDLTPNQVKQSPQDQGIEVRT